MKKYYIFAILSIFSIILFSCSEEEHVHDYVVNTIEPTCVSDGYDEYKCSCGDIFQENFIRAFGHKSSEYVYDYEKQIKYKECIVCKIKLEENAFELIDYDLLYNLIFINEGTEFYLEVHDKQTNVLVREYEGKVIEYSHVDGTCLSAASDNYYVEFKVNENLSFHNMYNLYGDYGSHKFGEWKEGVKPDCINDGENYRECEYNCGTRETQTIKNLGGHNFTVNKIRDNNILHLNATCDKCDVVIDEDYNLLVDTVEPTCEKTGTITYSLQTWNPHYGDISYNEVVEFGEPVSHKLECSIVVEPTDVNDGMLSVKCVNCTKLDYYNMPNISSSAYQKEVLIEPTCTESGSVKYLINIEGHNIEITKKIEALGHNLDNGECDICGFEDYFNFVLFEDEYYVNGFKENVHLKEIVIPNYTSTGDEVVGVWQDAFANSEIEKVSFSENIKYLYSRAFVDSNLKEIVFAEGLEFIDIDVFRGTKVNKAILPNSLKTMKSGAFGDCDDLYSITLGQSLEEFEPLSLPFSQRLMEIVDLSNLDVENILKTCPESSYLDLSCYHITNEPKYGDLIYEEGFVFYCLEDVNFLIDYNIEGHTIKLPEKINGKSYNIYSKAFRYNKFDRIEVPGTIERIGHNAFSDSNTLTYVDFAEGLKYIERYVFYNCPKMKVVSIPNSVEYIEDFVLSGLPNLKELFIPFIGNTYNHESGKLQSIFGDVDVILDLLAITGETFIPESATDYIDFKELILIQTTEIKDYAFYGKQYLKQVKLNEGIKKIGVSAFSDTGISELVIPETVEYLGNNFINFNKINDLVTPFLGNTIEDNRNVLDFISSINSSNFKNIKLTQSTKIHEEQFKGITASFSLSIPKVEIIEKNAFCDSGVVSINDANNLVEIGENAFYGCVNLENFDFNNVKIINEEAFALCILGDIDLSNVVEIHDSAFAFAIIGNIYLKNIEYVGEQAFYNESEVDFDIYYNNNLSRWFNIDFVNIQANPLNKYRYLYVLNENEEYVQIIDLVVPADVTVIKPYVFSGYKSLTSVTFNEGLVEIGEQAFSGCINYSGDVKLPDTTRKIGNYAFYSTSVENVFIPTYVNEIGIGAFIGNSKLTNVTTPFLGRTIDDNEDYQLYDIYGNDLASSIRTLNLTNITNIKGLSFYGCSSLESITLPSTLLSIDETAFSGCNRLVEVFNLSNLDVSEYIPTARVIHNEIKETQIDQVGDFRYIKVEEEYFIFNLVNQDVEELIFPDSIDGSKYTICSRLINDNETIKKIDLGLGTKLVEGYAFNWVNHLYTVIERGAQFENYAFNNCYRLVELYNLGSYNVLENITPYNYIIVHDNIDNDSTINITKDGLVFSVVDSSSANGTRLIDYIGKNPELILPEYFNDHEYQIAYFALYMNDIIEKLVVPETIITIGQAAFSNIYNLKFIQGIMLDSFYFDRHTNLEYVVIERETEVIDATQLSDSNLKAIYYEGSKEEFEEIQISGGGSLFDKAIKYFYSENQPVTEGDYWHYNENNEIVVW